MNLQNIDSLNKSFIVRCESYNYLYDKPQHTKLSSNRVQTSNKNIFKLANAGATTSAATGATEAGIKGIRKFLNFKSLLGFSAAAYILSNLLSSTRISQHTPSIFSPDDFPKYVENIRNSPIPNALLGALLGAGSSAGLGYLSTGKVSPDQALLGALLGGGLGLAASKFLTPTLSELGY